MDKHAEHREALREIQQIFQQAIKNNTIGDMREHVDSDFSFVSFTDKSFDNFDAFEKQWKITRDKMIGNGHFSSELNPETTVFVDDIAICKGNSNNKMVDSNGKNFEYTSHWTVIFKRNDNLWKVLRAHNSLDPFANPMLLDRFKKEVLKYSLIAFLMGGITCSLASYFLIR